MQLSTSALKLHILHGQLSDAGRYSCRAWNDAGEATAIMEVVILGKLRCCLFLNFFFQKQWILLIPILGTCLYHKLLASKSFSRRFFVRFEGIQFMNEYFTWKNAIVYVFLLKVINRSSLWDFFSLRMLQSRRWQHHPPPREETNVRYGGKGGKFTPLNYLLVKMNAAAKVEDKSGCDFYRLYSLFRLALGSIC